MKYLKKTRFAATVFALIAGLGSFSQAQAATLISAGGNSTGNGTFTLNGGSDRVKTVYLSFEQNRNFTLRFTPDDTRTIVLLGKWRGNNNETVDLDIDRGPDGKVATGTGRVVFRASNSQGKRQPSLFTLSGRTTTGKSITYRLSFNGTGVQFYSTKWSDNGSGGGPGNGGPGHGGGSGNIEQLFSTKNGTGRVEVSGQRDSSVRSAKVELNRSGAARIELTGGKTWVFAGRWTSSGTNKVRVNLDSVSSMRRTTGWLGNGEIKLKNGSFESLDFSGKLGSDNFTATFDAR